MATNFSMLQIINAALLSQGMDEVTENDGTPEYRTLSQNWPMIVESEMEDGLYSFTKQQEDLVSRIDGKYGYDDGFLVPQASLHVRRVYPLGLSDRTVFTEWVQDEQAVYLDSASGCTVEYMVSADEHLWSANFARGVQMKLEAVILRAMKEEAREAMAMEEMAETLFQRARTKSSKERSPSSPRLASRIAQARFRSRFDRGAQ